MGWMMDGMEGWMLFGILPTGKDLKAAPDVSVVFLWPCEASRHDSSLFPYKVSYITTDCRKANTKPVFPSESCISVVWFSYSCNSSRRKESLHRDALESGRLLTSPTTQPTIRVWLLCQAQISLKNPSRSVVIQYNTQKYSEVCVQHHWNTEQKASHQHMWR